METIGTIALIIIFGIIVVYAILVTMGYDNLRGITIHLDEIYSNTKLMACAVFEELEKRGKECEIIEMDEGYPKFMINGKKYVMVPKMASWRGFPIQVAQLRICKD